MVILDVDVCIDKIGKKAIGCTTVTADYYKGKLPRRGILVGNSVSREIVIFFVHNWHTVPLNTQSIKCFGIYRIIRMLWET